MLVGVFDNPRVHSKVPTGGRRSRRRWCIGVAVVLGSGDKAVLTRGGKVLFQGQMYSQYRVFVKVRRRSSLSSRVVLTHIVDVGLQ
jgi:hypothetical protein